MEQLSSVDTPSRHSESLIKGGAEAPPSQELGAPKRLSLENARARTEAIAAAFRRAARESRQPAPMLSGGGGFKARRGDRIFIRGVVASFIVLVLLPFLAASIYLPFYASDQFASEARFTVRNRKASPMDAIFSMGAPGASQQTQDAQVIANFLKSRAVIDELETKFNLREMFGNTQFDYLFRFATTDPKEDLVRYWKRQVTIDFDRTTGIMSVEVRAFRASDALAICSALLEISERMVNSLNERSKASALALAETELRRSEALLQSMSERMRNLRNTEGVLDADATALSINEVTAKLQLNLAKIEQDIETTRGQLSPNAPQVRHLNAQAAALREKIAEYQRKIASSGSGSSQALSGSANVLDRQKLELKIAQEQYAAAISVYEKARSELDVQGSFLLTFVRPQIAEQAEYPKRWFVWSIIVLPAALLWLILFGIVLLVRDHMAK